MVHQAVIDFVAHPAIAATEMARIIDPQMERSVRRFISQCEKEGTLPRKLAK